MINGFMYFKESPRGVNLVTLSDTSAQAILQEDGSVYCQPDTVFEGLVGDTCHLNMYSNPLFY